MLADEHAGRVEHLATREAAGVVRAHTKRWGIIRRRHHRSKSRAPADQDKEKTHTHSLRSSRAARDTDTEYQSEESEFEHPYLVQNQSKHMNKPKKSWWQFHTPPSVAHSPQAHYDLESSPNSHTNHPKLGTGVLSALLALYGQEHGHEHEGESGTWSLRTSEDEGDLSGPDQPWLESKGKNKKSTSVGRTLHSASASASSLLAHLPSVPPALIPPALKHKEKAPATTAALVAGAGALTGAAVPQQTGLAPDLKRGYGLVRYKFEDTPNFDLTPSAGASKAPPVPPPTAVLTQDPWGSDPGRVEWMGGARTPPRLHLPRRTRSTDFDFTSGVGGTVKEDHEGEAAASARVVVNDGDESPDTLGGTTMTAADSPASGMGLLRPDMNLTPASTLQEGKKSKRWTGMLKDIPLPLHGMHLKGFSLSMPGTPNRHPASGASTPGGTSSGIVTPDEKMNGDYFGAKWMEEQKERERKERKDKERREKERRRKRKKAEVYVRLSLVPRTLFTHASFPRRSPGMWLRSYSGRNSS